MVSCWWGNGEAKPRCSAKINKGLNYYLLFKAKTVLLELSPSQQLPFYPRSLGFGVLLGGGRVQRLTEPQASEMGFGDQFECPQPLGKTGFS